MLWEMFLALLGAVVVAALIRAQLIPPKKILSIYTKRGTWLGYYPRWAYWVVAVWHHQRQRAKRLNNYRYNSRDYRYSGVVPTPEEQALERPVSLTTDRHDDGVVLWGSDSTGRSVYARVVRLAGGRASVMLCVRDSSGVLYTTPNQPDSTACHCDSSTWSGSGLLLECVQPMRTWRLKFCGLLRKGSRATYNPEVSPDDDVGVVEARLDLVWRALKAPVDLFRDSSPLLLAHALAREAESDLRYFTSLDRDGYDQLGALIGTVELDLQAANHVDQQEADLWYLRGGRQHRWGMSEAASKLHRSVDLLNYFENGDMLYLQTLCYPSTLTHFNFGYLQTANGDYLPLTETSFSLPEVGEDGTVPSHVMLSCKVGCRKVEVCIQFSKDSTAYYTGDPWTLKHDICFSDSFMMENKGSGVAIFTKSYTDLCPVPEREVLFFRNESEEEEEEYDDHDTLTPLAAAITDFRCRDPKLSGGKGASLAVMSSLLQDECPERFSVPDGVVVTTVAWQHQLQSAPQLTAALTHLEKAIGSAQEKRIKDACNRASEIFLHSIVCEEVRTAITGALQELYDDRDPQIRFAVRSSGCDEDSGEASAAGQNLTVLGCRGISEVIAALPKCWASLLQFTSVQYRRQRGLNPVGQMAVVIQEMVAAEVSGVIFTRHPTTGSPASVIITANYGLGESVVSGSSEPDTIVVKRSWRDVLTLGSTTVGAKALRHDMDGKGGTSEEQVAAADRAKSCVDDQLALRLTKLAIHIENAFCSPRDIEFAVTQNKLYMLQARPITSLHSWSDLELQLEIDSAMLTDSEMWSRANVGEVLPGPLTPLTLSVVIKTVDLGYQMILKKLCYKGNIDVDPSISRHIAVSYQHAMLDVIEGIYRNMEDEVTIGNISTDFSIFGHIVTTDDVHKKAVKRNGVISSFDKLFISSFMMWNTLYNNRRISYAKDHFQQYAIPTTRALNADILYQEICRRLPDLMEMMKIHVSSSMVSAFTQTIVIVMLTEGNKDISNTTIADIARLLSSSCDGQGQDSTGVPAALTELAKVIRQDEECKDFLAMSSEEGKVWLESHPFEVGDSYLLFMERHGHRCIKELALDSVSWGMDGRSLVSTLQSMVAIPCSKSSPKPSNDMEFVLDNLMSPIRSGTRRALHMLLPYARKAVLRREASKSCLVKVCDAFRRAYRILGNLLVAEGRLPDAELVFFLQHHEIGLMLENRSPSIVDRAVKRRRLIATMKELQFQEISVGPPKPVFPTKYNLATTGLEYTEQIVKGTPVCLGKAQGPARVVTRLEDANTIKSGDILITYGTDVGWTPYFPLLAGVITEIGGLISHGAVVAREYGLPCIVGATGATQALRSGEVIALNGYTGTVTRLAAAAGPTE